MTRVAVFFEASGVVRDALISQGIDAVSVDYRPTERPGPHIQDDVFRHLNDGWAGAIMHPTCTHICGSGLHWNDRVPGRNLMTAYGLNNVRRLMDCNIEMWAIENPVGLIGTEIQDATQWFQPYHFGDDASKTTGLWLRRLPPLVIPPRKLWHPGRLVQWKGRTVRRWGNQTDSGQNRLPPSQERWAERSETYPGPAMAMAMHWAPYFRGEVKYELF